MFQIAPQYTLILLLSILIISACSTNTTQTSSALENTNINGKWRIEFINNKPANDLSPAFIEFHHGQATGNTGCNQFNGRYEQTDAALKFPTPLVITGMMCPPALAQQEDDITRALTRISHFSYLPEQGILNLLDANNHKLIRLIK